MIEIFKRTLKDKTIKKIDDFEIGSWVKVTNPSEEEIEELKNFKLDMNNIKDALDLNELPRIEKDERFVYIFIRTSVKKDGNVKTIPILIAISKNFILTVSKEDIDIFKNIMNDRTTYTTQKTKFLIKTFLLNSKFYENVIKQISKKLRSKKADIFKLKEGDIVSLVEIEETLEDLISSFIPTVSVYRNILTRKLIKVYEKDKGIIEDAIISGEETLDLCKSSIKMVHGIRESYSTLVSMQTNRVIKILTVITIMLTIPTITSSVFGMNVSLPFQNNPLAIFYVLLFTSIIIFGVYLIFLKMRWL